MAYETLIVEIEDNVALIRLNRPDALNALNSKLMAELGDAVFAAPGITPMRDEDARPFSGLAALKDKRGQDKDED